MVGFVVVVLFVVEAFEKDSAGPIEGQRDPVACKFLPGELSLVMLQHLRPNQKMGAWVSNMVGSE
jgi:hypothetical protein